MSIPAAAAIIPITTGLRNFSNDAKMLLFLNLAYIVQINNTIIKDGSVTANVAIRDPSTFPVTVYPIYVALFIPIGPGVICDIAMMSVNSLAVIHPFTTTTWS